MVDRWPVMINRRANVFAAVLRAQKNCPCCKTNHTGCHCNANIVVVPAMLPVFVDMAVVMLMVVNSAIVPTAAMICLCG